MAATGGTGGLGLLTASWMQLQGASSLTLTGRTGRLASTPTLHSLVSGAGVVTLMATDAATAEGAASLAYSKAATALGGILHAAGIQVQSCCLLIKDHCFSTGAQHVCIVARCNMTHPHSR